MASKNLRVTLVEENELVQHLMNRIETLANEAIKLRGVFTIGISGGSIINFLSCDDGLKSLKTDWKSWRIFLCDERIVPEIDPESTGGLYKSKLFPKIPEFPLQNFLGANLDLNTSEDIAADYEKQLRQLWTKDDSSNFGKADCLLLGVGPDGHTCSLFPDHKALSIMDSWVTFVEDSPKPPPKRITLTYPFINKAEHIFVVGMGKQKLDILNQIQSGKDYPVGRVENTGGLEWIIGRGGSSK